ncbi:MAG: uridine phosphorylase [Eubacteriales bacterium]|jgi:uridine phosphorylase|nr:uridine phosphorylase [Eubacteriales bacterium]
MKKFYHIELTENPNAKYAIIPGDPGRVEKIAKHLENPVHIGTNREFVTYKGSLCGENVLVASTGIGGPSAAIAVEELYMAGVRTFIRVGTCGGMQKDVVGGDLVVATAAIRMEGTSKEYVPIEFPAVSDFDVTSALVMACRSMKKVYHTGVVQSKDSFYGQHAPERMPTSYELKSKWDAWIQCGCLASEMECAAVFTVSNALGAKSGAILSVIWNQERENLGLNSPKVDGIDAAIAAAVSAVEILIKQEMQS